MTTLSQLFFAHSDHLSDKWEQYLGIYEAELGGYVAVGRPVSLLEIGVSNGGSLQIWRDYLPPGSEVVGIDVNPACGELRLGQGIEVHVGDAASRAVLDGILRDRTFDVIIDDGSHLSSHIVATYEALLPRVRGGGKYIVEDLHASYWPDFGGGLRQPQAAMEYFKALVDGLNVDGFRDPVELPGAERARLNAFGHGTARMSFYDSVLVIERLAQPRTAPYRQMFTGGTAPVTDPALWMAAVPLARTETILVGESAARHIDRVLLAELDRTADDRRARIELEQLKASTSWRVTAPLRALKRLISGG